MPAIGGRCAAVVQMSCATSSRAETVRIRERLLAKHQLLGVFSMPNDLFHPVGVVTCIMIFQAHSPHPQDYRVFFGYFKDDGFGKIKHVGRVDQGRWNEIQRAMAQLLFKSGRVSQVIVFCEP